MGFDETRRHAPCFSSSLKALRRAIALGVDACVIAVAFRSFRRGGGRHFKIEKFDDPDAAACDRYSPGLNKHAKALVCEWSDAVLFATRKF